MNYLNGRGRIVKDIDDGEVFEPWHEKLELVGRNGDMEHGVPERRTAP